ncbi:TPA: hypothetical protein ACVO3J_004661, partial [Vibrio alginolyticus]
HKPTWPNADYLKHEKPQTNQTLSVIQETAESLCYSQSPYNHEMRPFMLLNHLTSQRRTFNKY